MEAFKSPDDEPEEFRPPASWFIIGLGLGSFAWACLIAPFVIYFVQLYASVDLAWGFRSLEASDWWIDFLSDEFLDPTRWLLGLVGLQHFLPTPAPAWAIGLALNSVLLSTPDFWKFSRGIGVNWFRMDESALEELGKIPAESISSYASDILKFALVAIGTLLGVGPLLWWFSWLVPDNRRAPLIGHTLLAYFTLLSGAGMVTGAIYGLNALVTETSTGQAVWASVQVSGNWIDQALDFVSISLIVIVLVGVTVVVLGAITFFIHKIALSASKRAMQPKSAMKHG